MKNFNWEEFKQCHIAVHCDTEEKANDFLEYCKNNGVVCMNGWIIQENKTCYSYGDSLGTLYLGDKKFYEKRGYKIIEWSIDKMKDKKVYKIQDLFKDEFIGKKVKTNSENGEFIFTITKYDNIFDLVIHNNVEYSINDLFFISEMLKLEFELLESEDNKMKEKDKKIYIAGSLFNEAEVAQRKKEENLLREIGYENIYNPINAPCNDKSKLPTAVDIFWGDTKEILKSDVVVADLSNVTDLGVACEMGIIWTCNYIHRLAQDGYDFEEILDELKEKKLVAHLSDIRKGTAHKYKGNYIPWGTNQFLLGCVEDVGVVKDNFSEVLEELKNEE